MRNYFNPAEICFLVAGALVGLWLTYFRPGVGEMYYDTLYAIEGINPLLVIIAWIFFGVMAAGIMACAKKLLPVYYLFLLASALVATLYLSIKPLTEGRFLPLVAGILLTVGWTITIVLLEMDTDGEKQFRIQTGKN